jgi:hypothetical protein
MALAASASWDDLACSGLRQAAQLGWAFRCGTSSKDSASDFFGLLARQQRSWARLKQVGEVGLRRRLSIDGDLGMWGNIDLHSDGNKGNGIVAWSTAVGVARPPRPVILRGDESEVERYLGPLVGFGGR